MYNLSQSLEINTVNTIKMVPSLFTHLMVCTTSLAAPDHPGLLDLFFDPTAVAADEVTLRPGTLWLGLPTSLTPFPTSPPSSGVSGTGCSMEGGCDEGGGTAPPPPLSPEGEAAAPAYRRSSGVLVFLRACLYE